MRKALITGKQWNTYFVNQKGEKNYDRETNKVITQFYTKLYDDEKKHRTQTRTK